MAENEEKHEDQTSGGSDDQGKMDDDPGFPLPGPDDEPEPGPSGGG